MERWYKSERGIKVGMGPENENVAPAPAAGEQYLPNSRNRVQSNSNEPPLSDEELEAERQESTNLKEEADWRARMLARRDVHVVIISYLFEAIAQFCLGLARNGTELIIGNFCF
jgi:hypothetical protein